MFATITIVLNFISQPNIIIIYSTIFLLHIIDIVRIIGVIYVNFHDVYEINVMYAK